MKKVRKKIKFFQKKIIRQTRMFCRVLAIRRRRILRAYKKEKKLLIRKWNYSLMIFQRVWLKKTRWPKYFLSSWRGKIRQSFYVSENRWTVLNLTLLICIFLISGISFTNSFFSDEEISSENYWRMALLDITATGNDFAPLVSYTEVATTSVSVVNEGNLIMKYSTTIQNVVGNLCPYLDMRIYASSSQIYNGGLVDDTPLPDTTLVATSTWQYDFETIMTTDDESLQNQICIFDLVFQSWQQEIPDFTAGGYTDETSVQLTVNSGEWADEEEPLEGCTYTQGYWKTHSIYGPAPYNDAWALLGVLEEETIFFLSNQSYIEILETPPANNAYYQLAHQYIAALLNQLNNASVPTEVQAAMDEAVGLFNTYTPDDIDVLAGNDPLRHQFIELSEFLDRYNEGEIGPGHCCDE